MKNREINSIIGDETIIFNDAVFVYK